jgi:putative endonuclease
MKPKNPKTTNYKRGLMAEYIAALYLMLKGYRILKHRYKTPVGEIDLIAEKGKILIAVEVKLRPSLSSAQEAISRKAQTRIIKTIQWYMSQNSKKQYDTIRCDVIGIANFSIQHLDNAWQETHT